MKDIEKRILRQIGEDPDNPDVFTDANITPIRDSVNDATEEIAMMTGVHSGRYYLQLYTGVMFYRLKFTQGQFGWVKSAWFVDRKIPMDQTSVTALSMENPYWMQADGDPYRYMQIGQDVIGVYPKPSGAGLAIELECAVIPARYTSDDEKHHIRRDYEKTVASYAMSEYYASRGDAKEASRHYRKYSEMLGLDRSHNPYTHQRHYYHGSRFPNSSNQTFSS